MIAEEQRTSGDSKEDEFEVDRLEEILGEG